MTLENVYAKDRFDSIIAVMPDVVTVWKVVLADFRNRCYIAPFVHKRYSVGEMDAEVDESYLPSENPGYDLFFHFWVNRIFVLERLNELLIDKFNFGNRSFEPGFERRLMESPLYVGSGRIDSLIHTIQYMLTASPVVVECAVHKSWITTIGRQYDGLSVVCRKAIFPEYGELKPRPDMRILVGEPEHTRFPSPFDEIVCSRIGNPEPVEKYLVEAH
jgi:hypothetical protein